MELRHLRYFVAVAEELHFGRAAERLHMTQPPLSRQIRDLENELGVELFDRSQRRIRLTKVGEVLLTEARRVVEDARRFEQLAHETAVGEVGHLRVGVVHSSLYGVVPDLLRRFSDRHPAVRLTVREAVTSQLLTELSDDRLDVAFIRPAAPPPMVEVLRLLVEPVVAVVPRGHALAEDEGPAALSQLLDEPFVLFPRELGPGYWDLIMGACREQGRMPIIGHLADQVTTMVGLVAAGLGVSLVPRSVWNLQLPGVAYRPLDIELELPLEMAWRRHDPMPARDNFITMVSGPRLGARGR